MATAREIEEAVKAQYGYYPSSFYQGIYYGRTITLPGFGDVERVDHGKDSDVDSYGYDSGSAWVVFKVVGETFRMNGYIDSYGDPEFDGSLHKVEERTETITRTVWSQV